MSAKTEHLQIRVTVRQKALLKQAAAAAGKDLSSYVLARALPDTRIRFAKLLRLLGIADEERYALAELNDLLTGLGPAELRDAIEHADVARLSPFLQNYVAAMVEQASQIKRVPPPAWTAQIPPLDVPWFATPMKGLRLHLMRASPVAFKRRNIFVDASIGSRV